MNQNNSKSIARQQGFTLVELGISMVLIASMVLAGFYIIKRIRTDAAINAAIASTTISLNQANAGFAGMTTTTGANLTTLAAMNIWPKERLVKSTNASGVTAVDKVMGQFSGSEEMMWANTTVTPVGTFVYHLWNIPQEACMPLIKNLAAHPNTLTIYAGAHSETKPPSGGIGHIYSDGIKVKAGTGALSLTNAGTACNKGNSIDIAIEFDKS